MKSFVSSNKMWLVLVLMFAFAYPFLVGQSGYFMTLFVMIIVYSITAMALNLLTGYGGQISIGHAGFLAIGSYSVAILASKYGLPFFVTLPLSGVITGLVGFIIAVPAVRLSGHFLAVATLGFGLAIPQIALNWDSLTGGYSGISLARPAGLATDLSFFYVVLAVMIFLTWLLNNILKSRMGRAFIAIRESEVAAEATGINLSFYKAIMFTISAFFAGLAGGLYAYWIGFVSPNDFTVVTSFLLLGMIVVGGLASIPGSIIGAILFSVLPELTSSFIGLTNIIIGVAIVLIILFRPAGFVSILDIFARKSKASQGEVLETKGIREARSNANL